jgi:hypothetical protein
MKQWTRNSVIQLYAVYSLQACGAENGCRERISPYGAAEPGVTAVYVIAPDAELRNSAGPGRAGSAAAPFSAGAHLQTVQDISVYDLFFTFKRNLFSYGPYKHINQRSKTYGKKRNAGKNRREDPGHTRCSFRLDKAGSTTSVFPVAARNFVANRSPFFTVCLDSL